MTQANRREFVTSLAALPVALVDTGRTMQTSILPELLQKSAIELSQAISSKAVSCREVMATYLDHIERINPKVNAIVSLQDRDGLLQNAQERDAQLSRGEYLGWMHGFPHAIKDLSSTKGIRTTRGSPLVDGIPTEDSILAERIKSRGAILIGKTNTPEFGLGSQTYNSVFGTTLNAYDQSRTSGGSSGGAAVSLALRMLPVADGSDMMGSLRNPGAFNNVFGFRPSFGRVPAKGDELYLDQLGYWGAMGRSVSDLAMLMSTIAGPDPRDPLSIEQDPRMFEQPLHGDVRGKRLGWLGDLGGHFASGGSRQRGVVAGTMQPPVGAEPGLAGQPDHHPAPVLGPQPRRLLPPAGVLISGGPMGSGRGGVVRAGPHRGRPGALLRPIPA